MMGNPPTQLSRRSFLSGSALVVAFSLSSRAFGQLAGGGEGGAGPAVVAPNLAGSLKSSPMLDSWIRIDADGSVTVFTGKVELGQGIRTALIQVAAEELDVPPSIVHLVTADTARTPDEGLTAGSHSMQDSGSAIRNAAANVRLLLVQQAARSWNVGPVSIKTDGNGNLTGPDGRTIGYGPTATALSLHVEAVPDAPLRNPARYNTIGTNMRRVDIPGKLTGAPAYLQDMRLPGMLHARMLRGPSFGTRFQSSDIAAVSSIPGVVKVVRQGNFLAVVAERGWAAITALRKLQDAPFVRTAPPPSLGDFAASLKGLPSRDIAILDARNATAPAAVTISARYSRPWLNHGSIGPSCAMARFEDGVMTVWT